MPFLECLRGLEMITPALASRPTAPGGGNQALTSMAPGCLVVKVLHHLPTCLHLLFTGLNGWLICGDSWWGWGGLYSCDIHREERLWGPNPERSLYPDFSPPPDGVWRGGGRSLNISGKVERVPLQFGKGDGRMLQVIEQHLDLSGGTRNSGHPLLLRFTCIFYMLVWPIHLSSFLSDGEVFLMWADWNNFAVKF